jgi:hypothetical protein
VGAVVVGAVVGAVVVEAVVAVAAVVVGAAVMALVGEAVAADVGLAEVVVADGLAAVVVAEAMGAFVVGEAVAAVIVGDAVAAFVVAVVVGDAVGAFVVAVAVGVLVAGTVTVFCTVSTSWGGCRDSRLATRTTEYAVGFISSNPVCAVVEMPLSTVRGTCCQCTVAFTGTDALTARVSNAGRLPIRRPSSVHELVVRCARTPRARVSAFVT